MSTPTKLAALCQFMEAFAPAHLAEDWDNVGLLVGDESRTIARVMTCLTLSHKTVAEAVREQADVVIAHHPLPFKPLKKITTATTTGRWLLKLMGANIAVYSPHTAFDSAAEGINEHLARKLGLETIAPLVVNARDPQQLGAGRLGILPTPVTFRTFAQRVKTILQSTRVEVVGDLDRSIERVAVGCGSAGGFLELAKKAQCDCFVTGEANLHTSYEAEALNIGLLLAGHYATERFHVEQLATNLAQHFSTLRVWASRDESEPMIMI
jgi:dinuclear metal center YbgI/SA1388 family protein